jgi:hypothetical protein
MGVIPDDSDCRKSALKVGDRFHQLATEQEILCVLFLVIKHLIQSSRYSDWLRGDLVV